MKWWSTVIRVQWRTDRSHNLQEVLFPDKDFDRAYDRWQCQRAFPECSQVKMILVAEIDAVVICE